LEQIFRGRSPSELPIEETTELELTINLRAARELGIRVDPQTIARATALIN
jgi:putative ABC transport system substrate-binding protein